VGLCEMVQHLAMFDYLSVSATMDDRVIEYVDHLHEHFVTPVRIARGRYLAPTEPGFGAEIGEASRAEYLFPDGPVWKERAAWTPQRSAASR
jgi:L-fuconate dehydratase